MMGRLDVAQDGILLIAPPPSRHSGQGAAGGFPVHQRFQAGGVAQDLFCHFKQGNRSYLVGAGYCADSRGAIPLCKSGAR